MHIKISKVANQNGKPKAFVVKVNGKKFPKGFRNWYFVSDREKAKELALYDYFLEDLKNNI